MPQVIKVATDWDGNSEATEMFIPAFSEIFLVFDPSKQQGGAATDLLDHRLASPILHVIVHQRDVADVRTIRVMQGAECWLDCKLVKSVFNLYVPPQHRWTAKIVKVSFDIAKLMPSFSKGIRGEKS